MKTKELRQKSKDELQRLLQSLREKLRQLRFDLASGKIKNVREIREIKKNIARILTILCPVEKFRIVSLSAEQKETGQNKNKHK